MNWRGECPESVPCFLLLPSSSSWLPVTEFASLVFGGKVKTQTREAQPGCCRADPTSGRLDGSTVTPVFAGYVDLREGMGLFGAGGRGGALITAMSGR